MGREIGRYLESPEFRYVVNSGLAAGSNYIKNLAEGETKKYLPFNIIEIYNPSSQEVTLKINSEHIVKKIPATAMISFEFSAIYDFEVYNSSSAATDADIEVTVIKKLTERELLKMIAKKLGAI